MLRAARHLHRQTGMKNLVLAGWVALNCVGAERHTLLHRLMTAFHERTDCPVLVNTSFNVRDEPIVCTPEDAYRCFRATDIDVLVVGRHVMLKSRQRAQDASTARRRNARCAR